MDIDKLKHRVKRLTERKEVLEAKHKGNEEKFTYHGGFDLGYVKGQISVLEDIIDDLTDEEDGQKTRG
jgi:hypothetical protein